MNIKENKKPKGNHLRIGRVSETNRIYLITSVTYQRKAIFRDFNNGRILVHSMRYFHDKQEAITLTYVVMPDHIHWLFQLGQNQELNSLINRFNGYTSLMINRTNGITEAKTWQPGYYDRAIRKEEDVKSIARYVIANPLRAGLVKNIGDYSLWDAIWLRPTIAPTEALLQQRPTTNSNAIHRTPLS